MYIMLGAIIGDMMGSPFEYKEFLLSLKKKIDYESRIKRLDTSMDLISKDSKFTDDTILTIAVLDAIVSNCSYEEKLREYCLRYCDIKNVDKNYFELPFSPSFISWGKGEKTNNSNGNGSAMRVSPVGYMFNSLDVVLEEAKKSAIPSHNTDEAIKGAQAVATSIYLSRKKYDKIYIKKVLNEMFGYNIDFNLEDLQKEYMFKCNCNDSVPQAIFCFLESCSFEDSIRKSISIGGDTDTIACINGSIAEAYYGVPTHLKNKALKCLDENLVKVLKRSNYYKIM